MTQNERIHIIDCLNELYPSGFVRKVRFDWCTNILTIRDSVLIQEKCNDIFQALNYDYKKISREYLPCDCYIQELNLLFVIDDFYKFSSYRHKTLEFYDVVKTNFNVDEYKKLCVRYSENADNYQKEKKANGFNFKGGASAKRAMLDVFMDLKPLINNLQPTLRLSVEEINNLITKEELKKLIESKLVH